MQFSIAALVAFLAISNGSPIMQFNSRAVTKLDPAAVAEAHPRDDTATRAISNSPIKTASGKCLLVDPLSGDFRENLTPIQVADCDGSKGQNWDVITKGKHNNVDGSALIVSSLTNACFDFNPSRNDRVSLFSCGGRADGSGKITPSQLFPFNGSPGPLQFTPDNQKTSCFTVQGNALVIANCKAGNPDQEFTFGGGAAASGKGTDAAKSESTGGSQTENTGAGAATAGGEADSGCPST